MALNKLWCEKYRPTSLPEVIFSSDSVRSEFNAILRSGSLPSLMFIGPPGTGKTSISQALLNDFGVLREDTLRVNCSDKKIEAIRDEVKSFSYTMPMGEFKVVQLEEMDYLSHEAQALLRSLIEEVSSSCRFIATANYSNKILPPIRSRFQEFVFAAPQRDEIMIRMAEVLEAEQISFELDDLEKVIAVAYPDVRKTLQLLEQCSKTGTLKLINTEGIVDWKLELLPLLERADFKAARKLVCESASKEELQEIYKFLYENLHRIKRLEGKADQAVLHIADYAYRSAFVADAEINVAALFIELGLL